ncbi:MAG: hypothetical protein E7598_07025 [Ruminococcaceae bacterium]|nr:hypothetical protein [Oscillospiraceae bacterium]
MRRILKNLLRLLLYCFVTSPVSCALYYYRIIPNTDIAYARVLLVITVGFIAYYLHFLRRGYSKLRRNKKKYFTVNLSSYGIFMLITAVVYILFGEIAYAWMFNSLKLLAFVSNDFSSFGATAIMHIIMLCVIAIAPYTVKKARRRR